MSKKATSDITKFCSQLWQMLADLKILKTFGFSKKFAIKPLSCFPPDVNYETTFDCRLYMYIFNALVWRKLQVR